MHAGEGAVAGLHEQLAALMPPSQAAAAAHLSSSSTLQQQQQQQLSGAMQRRIQHNIQLAARCAKLENEKQQLAREKADMQGKHAEGYRKCRALMYRLWLDLQPENPAVEHPDTPHALVRAPTPGHSATFGAVPCPCVSAAGKLSKAHAAVEKLHSQLQLAGQPHGFLLSQLAAAEAAASQAQQQLKAAQVGTLAWLVFDRTCCCAGL
jgi:septal ring factor EnvC (AmiA/AmiB activator)